MTTGIRAFEAETQAIDVNGHTLYVSIMRVNAMPENKDEERALVSEAYMQLGQEFRTQPGAENQKTACIISDGTPMIERLGADEVMAFAESWFNASEEQDATTQRFYYELFGLPTISINVTTGIPSEFFAGRYEGLSSSANVPYFVGSMGEAIELATKLLRIAHRY